MPSGLTGALSRYVRGRPGIQRLVNWRQCAPHSNFLRISLESQTESYTEAQLKLKATLIFNGHKNQPCIQFHVPRLVPKLLSLIVSLPLHHVFLSVAKVHPIVVYYIILCPSIHSIKLIQSNAINWIYVCVNYSSRQIVATFQTDILRSFQQYSLSLHLLNYRD